MQSILKLLNIFVKHLVSHLQELGLFEENFWSAKLKTSKSQFFARYAGTKDKKAITRQYMTFESVSSQNLLSLNQHPILSKWNFIFFNFYSIKMFKFCIQFEKNRFKCCKIGNLEYVDKHLRLGELSGNSFKVTVSNGSF